MKKIVIIIFLLFSVKVLQSQNYYYYFGNKISLEHRTDKAAIILNSNFFKKEIKEKNISEIINCDCDITEVGNDIYLINFKEERSLSEVQNFIAAVSAKKDFFKFVSPVYYGESRRVSQIPTDEFVVKLKDIKQKDFLDIINVRNNVRIIGNVSDEKGFLLKSNNGVTKNALELSDLYLRSGLFEYAEPNFIYPEFCLLNYTPNDPFYPKQWSLNNTGQSVPTGSSSFGDQASVNGLPGADMDVNLAWDFTKGSASIKIGILDTGIDSTHPDFNSAGHLMTGYDAFYNKYGVPADSGFYGGHGTCTAGLAGALINNSAGIAGVAPECKLMAIRIFNLVGSSSVVQMSRAFDTARVIGLDVLSNSWTGGTASSTLTNAINNAALNGRGGLGCCIFFASGNDGRNSVWFPSYLENVISVGGSTNQDQKKAPGTGNQYWWGGNYGEDENGDLDVVAPTVCYTTDIQGVYGYNNTSGFEGDYFDSFRGTSTSCPNAAGIAALMLSVNPSQTRLEVTDKLYRGCDKIDNLDYSVSKTYGKWNKYCGYGRVNAYNSVRLAAGADVTPPTIDHKNVNSVSSTYPTIVTAEIIDQDGSPVPSSGDNQPMLLFRLNKNNSGWSSFDSVNANSVIGNNFTFLIPCQGFETQVQYYIRAEDYNNNQSVFPRGAPNSSWLCYFSIGNFTTESNKIGSFICADPGATFSPAVNFNNFTIVNSRVQIYLRHSSISDEIIELCSPNSDANNNKKCLFASNGGSGADINGAVITDSADQFWINGVPPYTNGIFKGDYILNGLNGTNAFGNWQILNYDQFTGNQAQFDSVIITFTKTSGSASPCARRFFLQDSVLDFGEYLIIPDSLVKDFYLKNTGIVNLNISNVTFTGIQPENFSLVYNAPGSILPGDSGIFSVKYRSLLERSSYSGSFENAVLQIQTDDPSKQYFDVSLQISEIITPVELSSFTFNVSERNLTLNWSTVFEKNNSGFDIEKMRITGDTLKDWRRIGFVKGSGNSGGPNNYSFEDRKLSAGNYRYRLKQIDFNGIFKYYYLSDNVEIDIPSSFALSQNYPNPFNPVTKIDYDIPVDGRISLIIYDISGREISTLSNEFKNAGYFTSEFNGNNFSSGIYFYRLVFFAPSGNVRFTSTKKMTLLK